MEVIKYQKVLQVAETILSKVDLPQETFDKYNEFKEKMLDDFSENQTGQAEVEVELRAELLAVHDHFVSTTYQIVANMLSNDESKEESDGLIGKFVDYFNRKKKIVSDAIMEGMENCGIETKVVFQRLKDTVEEMEQKFDKYVVILNSLDNHLYSKKKEIELQTELTNKLQKELGNTKDPLRERESLLEEVKILRIEKDEIGQRHKTKDAEIERLRKEISSVENSLAAHIDQMEQTHRHTLRSLQEYDRVFDRFSSFFKQIVPKNQAEIFESKNLSAMMDIAEDLVERLVRDNRGMATELEKRDEYIGRIKDRKAVTGKRMQEYVSEFRQLIEESNSCMSSIDKRAIKLNSMRLDEKYEKDPGAQSQRNTNWNRVSQKNRVYFEE